MEIIDNFLPSYNFKQIYSTWMSPTFDWYYTDEIVVGDRGRYQFYHRLYLDSTPTQKSPYMDFLQSCFIKLRVTNLIRVKSNLTPKTFFHRKSGYHIDCPNSKTAIFYVNNNNGWTEFKKGGKVKCVENRIVIFDSNLEHRGVTATNDRKVIINFNYDSID